VVKTQVKERFSLLAIRMDPCQLQVALLVVSGKLHGSHDVDKKVMYVDKSE
jgi:hypothetical protein